MINRINLLYQLRWKTSKITCTMWVHTRPYLVCIHIIHQRRIHATGTRHCELPNSYSVNLAIVDGVGGILSTMTEWDD
jgi:hypothetical protein